MSPAYTFHDRFEAGKVLAGQLQHYAQRPDVIVLALPRGGVPIAYEISRSLGVPMDVFLVRKLGVPGHEELAMGAIASGGVRVINDEVVTSLQINPKEIDQVAQIEQQELERRERDYRRGDAPPPQVAGKTVILVDDGLATGSTMRAAAEALQLMHPARIVVAVPTASPDTCDAFRQIVDEVVCAITPEPFRAVGIWYEHFPQLSDEEVRELLDRARQEYAAQQNNSMNEITEPHHGGVHQRPVR
jgi:predicted phosphoribosyltransferase